MEGAKQKLKVALLVNILAPYRVPVYQKLGHRFKLFIFSAGEEDNRGTWQNLNEQLEDITVKRSWGFTFPYRKLKAGKVFENKYIHVNPGYFLDLFRFKPDAVITNEIGFRTFAAMVYGFLFRKPVWVWWGGTLHTERQVGGLKRTIRSLIALLANHWISYGATSTEYLVTIGVKRDNIIQIQNCVDERLFLKEVQPALSLQPKPVFLFVGRLVGLKGISLLLQAVGRLQREGRDFSLLLVGSGPEKDTLETYVRELGLSCVRFHPPQVPHNMPGIYRSADFLIFPTLSDVWGLVANEALWSGLPVISSIYAGCTQEIIPVANSFDPLNEEDFIAVMKRALDGEIAKPDVSKLKTVQQVADLIINDIERTVDEAT